MGNRLVELWRQRTHPGRGSAGIRTGPAAALGAHAGTGRAVGFYHFGFVCISILGITEDAAGPRSCFLSPVFSVFFFSELVLFVVSKRLIPFHPPPCYGALLPVESLWGFFWTGST